MENPELLDLYSDYLISSFKLVTATNMSAVLNDAVSHDKISRFLGQRFFDGIFQKVQKVNDTFLLKKLEK